MSPSDRDRAGVALALLACLFIHLICNSGCPNPYLTAYRSTATVRATAVATEQALADSCDLKRRGCLETHGAATPAYATCVEPCRKALDAWTRYTRPAINTALLAAVGSIGAAEAAKLKLDIVAILRPVTCAIARGVPQWGHLLPVSAKATVDALARGLAGYVCPKEVP